MVTVNEELEKKMAGQKYETSSKQNEQYKNDKLTQ